MTKSQGKFLYTYNDMQGRQEPFQVQPIGIIHSCFKEKFGIPRQAGLVPSAMAELELFKEFGREEMFRELEQFSHIWVSFIFHKVLSEGWRPTIRPPWLGGQKRVGVFASRSPHRPNFIGLSAVKLHEVKRKKGTVVLTVSGGDFLDKTPVVDIRPYIPYSDNLADATKGYTHLEEGERVCFSEQAELFCQNYYQKTGRNLYALLEEVVSQDPRPAFQREVDREFGVLLWDVNSRFVYRESGGAEILGCEFVTG